MQVRCRPSLLLVGNDYHRRAGRNGNRKAEGIPARRFSRISVFEFLK
jgi:hypothetical protein